MPELENISVKPIIWGSGNRPNSWNGYVDVANRRVKLFEVSSERLSCFLPGHESTPYNVRSVDEGKSMAVRVLDTFALALIETSATGGAYAQVVADTYNANREL